MTPDLTYRNDGLFTRFYPETPAGETAWREMEKDGVAAVFVPHGKMIIAQLRAAGYTVAKAKKAPAWTSEDDKLLAELGI